MIAELAAVVLIFQQEEARRQMEASIAKQKDSIQKQIGSTGFFTPGWFTSDTPEECSPLSAVEVEPLIAAAAKTHQVDAKIVRAVMRQESAFRPCAVSAKGAQGLMQLMPATAERLGVQNSFDPGQNVEAGVRLLKELLSRYKGDLKLALAAYNAGPERVDGKVPDLQETKAYVVEILKSLGEEKKP
jgi:soluble lytic murein transglycosylase-like protein